MKLLFLAFFGVWAVSGICDSSLVISPLVPRESNNVEEDVEVLESSLLPSFWNAGDSGNPEEKTASVWTNNEVGQRIFNSLLTTSFVNRDVVKVKESSGVVKNLEVKINLSRRNSKNSSREKRNTLTTTTNCPSGHFECASDTSLCVPQAAICNGKFDCPDESDEEECENLHDKKFWDTFFQKRPGADVGKNDTCKYALTGKAKEDLRSDFSSKIETSAASTTTSESTKEDITTLGGCHCSGEKLFCQNLHLSNLNMIPGDVVFLDLSGSRVDNMNFTADGSRFQHLHTLILSSTSLKEIMPGLLNPLSTLETLHLTGNKLQSIANRTFSSNPNMKKLILGHNQLSTLYSSSFTGLKELQELDLRHNKLQEKSLDRIFTELNNLRIMHLSYNQIEVLNWDVFSGLEKLEMLSLTKNRITHISSRTFENLTALNHLYLSYNRLEVLEDHTFCNLRSLLNLNLNDNGLIRIEPNAFTPCLEKLQSLVLERNKFGELEQSELIFSNLTELQYIYFDQFWMCSWAPHVRNCEPKGDGISSQENLLDSIVLRTCVWIMGLVGVVGNLFVIVSRVVLREKNRVHSFYIKNLAVADLLMGVFLLSIGYHDLKFKGEYLAQNQKWRHSLTCQWTGLISTLSSEASVFVLTLITLDRYLSIVRPFNERRNSIIPAITIILILWLISFLLSYVPLSGLFDDYFGSYFYTSNGLCLPLYIHNPFDKGFEFGLLYSAVNSFSFVFITYAYWNMLKLIHMSSKSIRSTQLQQDSLLAKRFALVVLTDMISWGPIVISKTLAMSGFEISSEFYGWLAVFVLPVNSALNPIIYTMTTKLFKQQVAHFTVGFRKRLGMATDESTTSSLFYRNRISRTLNTSLNSSMMMSTKGNSRMDRNPSQQIRNRYALSSINSVVANSTGIQMQNTNTNGQCSANPVDVNDIKYSETET